MTGKELQAELLHILNEPVNAYDFWPYLAEYAEEIGLDPDDPYAIADDKELADAFMLWVEKNDILERWLRDDASDVPPKFFFSGANPLPKGTWLVHHSRAYIGEFNRGSTFERLGLSTHFTTKSKVGSKNTDDEIGIGERVYVFGFQPHNDPAISRFGLPLSSQYGDKWYLFKTDAAVEAYHDGDEQTQAIFPAGSEYDLVEVSISDSAPWTVYIDDDVIEAETFDELLEKLEGKDDRMSYSANQKPCPPATSDIGLNLKNRQNAIQIADYGPPNPGLPNVRFWTKKGKMWGVSPMEAQTMRCGNCAAFDVSPRIKNCIASGIQSEGIDPYDFVQAGELGYCLAFKFKCAAARTCDAWVAGGPIRRERKS